jgi:hypothetical protein
LRGAPHLRGDAAISRTTKSNHNKIMARFGEI